jgi:hypothetical protein
MAITYHFDPSRLDLGQLLDGLESGAESWERAAQYLRNETARPPLKAAFSQLTRSNAT